MVEEISDDGPVWAPVAITQVLQDNPMAEQRLKKDAETVEREQRQTNWYDFKMTRDRDDPFSFSLDVWPREGYWQGGQYKFSVKATGEYPNRPPKVTCLTKIFHPNIDLSGNVCLNLLKVDIAEGGWSAAKSLIDIITGIFFLFQKPNSEDPLNKEAADLLHQKPTDFATTVKSIMKGTNYQGQSYPSVLNKNPYIK